MERYTELGLQSIREILILRSNIDAVLIDDGKPDKKKKLDK